MQNYSPEEIKEKIIFFAENNDNIRAVLLEGSRSNPTIEPDSLQDFDVVFIVLNFNEFLEDNSWTNIFGEKLLEQQPETFSFGEKFSNFFSFLIIYKEGFRIDFSIIPVEFRNDFKSSLRNVWLDKDGLYAHTPESSDSDFWIKQPNEKWFLEVCNEFWWVSIYVAKGLVRNEIPFAIKHREEILRPMLMQMLDWKIGIHHGFNVSVGKSGKFYPRLLDEKVYSEFLETYSDYRTENIWKSLFKMTEIFSAAAKEVGENFNFNYNETEEKNAMKYLCDLQKYSAK